MKFIGALYGITAFRESVEEYAPDAWPSFQETVDLVRKTYNFVSCPVVAPGAPLPPVQVYSGGKFENDGHSFAITQLVMATDGDIAVAGNTNHAEIFLDHLVNLLNKEFGYKIQTENLAKSYRSDLVVEFEKSLEEANPIISKIQSIVQIYGTKRRNPRYLTRINFAENIGVTVASAVDGVENTEFLIERRAGHPMEANRYYSSAPMKTEDHILALEEIEKALLTL